MLAFKVGLSLDMKRLSRMSKSASELAVERILKSEGEKIVFDQAYAFLNKNNLIYLTYSQDLDLFTQR
jgi:hypothetical protein